MKFVVTGALGHIGSRLIREFPKVFADAEIIMVDNMVTQRYCSLFNLPTNAHYKFIEADVLTADLNPIVKDADVVFQLAALTDAAGSFKNKDAVENNNFNATVKVAQACSENKCRMIHLSSTSVYGTQKEVVDENCTEDELKPQSPYAHTKLKEERYLQELGAANKLRFVTCRFGTICGISQGMRFHTAINKFCWQAVMGQPITVWRTALHQKRPYLTLEDAMNAFAFIIKNDLFDGNIYNVLTQNMTVHDIIQLIEKHIKEIKIEYVDTEIMNQLSYEVLNNRFRDKGFKFTGSIGNCIDETIKLLKPTKVC
jgi:nucleoside-diphosphate-sugar epimerase